MPRDTKKPSVNTSKDTLKSTVFLPSTAFPMRAELPKREAQILEFWQELNFFEKLRTLRQAQKAELFILHDGPPYANGNLHIGHALNKILKDTINRFQSAIGKNANYVPGWDCHGLPIEWKVEEEFRRLGKDKDSIPVVDFRAECRRFANHWLGVQREEFKRLGVMGDWEAPYVTMSYEAESAIVAELGKFLMQGSLYRGARPVMWSAAEKTALAEAEIEYKDRESVTIYVRFPVAKSTSPDLTGASVIIWTTTPWTIPANRATAFGKDIVYGLYRLEEVAGNSLAKKNETIIIADALAETIFAECGINKYTRLRQVEVKELSDPDFTLAHPLAQHGYTHKVPMVEADFVTTEQGTGLVHMAPAHGVDDYVLCMKHGVDVPELVDDSGRLKDDVPLFAGMSALKDNGKIADILANKGGLLGRGSLTHSYPHSWRSHAPLIYRTTPQWFISMAHGDLRQNALAALKQVEFYPSRGKNRLTAMIENRPDWCISRQRAWGVPIPVFFHKETGEVLRDQKVIDRVTAAFADKGADAWFDTPPQQFLGRDYKAEEYEQVQDIVDVWFDSGSTHAFVLEARQDKDMAWPADMYLEGLDQHRGWFHSSLLEACGTRQTAPYKSVLTHGFLRDQLGRKMSKSLGNTTSLQGVIASHGAEILRLWVASSDYYGDMRIDDEIIKGQIDHYRRLRNTLRYLLGSLAGFNEDELVAVADMPPLEKWVLHRLHELDGNIRQAIARHDYHHIFIQLHQFCNADLSAFYFDIRKDVLYCDNAAGLARRACRSVLYHVFDCLVVWLAPILAFTAEEAWQIWREEYKPTSSKGKAALLESVHFRTFPDVPDAWQDEALAEKMEAVRFVRDEVLSALEKEREKGRIKSSLDSSVSVYIPAKLVKTLGQFGAADIFITSDTNIIAVKATSDVVPPSDRKIVYNSGNLIPHHLNATVGVVVKPAQGEKCDRCWKIQPS
ncbi:MAG: isoleucine--tRNA ligase, partial [Proteobacteria bacterium]|nr:isoleucine--tRNA ligase [Pseudomonadota bacterium]